MKPEHKKRIRNAILYGTIGLLCLCMIGLGQFTAAAIYYLALIIASKE